MMEAAAGEEEAGDVITWKRRAQEMMTVAKVSFLA
jgi:hypothetical protein